MVSTADPTAGGAFVQLPVGNYVPAKMALQIAYPRPDADGVPSTARHKWLIPSKPYRIPIIVQGGAYPFGFRFGANHTLPGAEIGAFLAYNGTTGTYEDDGNYGVLYGTAPAAGQSYTVHIEVIDQDGGTSVVKGSVQWTIEADSTKFIYIDLNDAGSLDDGSYDEPFNTIDSAFGASAAVPTNQGKIAVFKQGTHTLSGHSGGYQLYLQQSINPASIIADPDAASTPVLDMKTGRSGSGMRFRLDSNSSDIYFSEVIFDGSISDLAATLNDGYQFLFFGSSTFNRATWFDCSLRNWQPAPGGNTNNNPAPISIQAVDRQYINFSRVTFDGTYNGNILVFDLQDSVFEHLTWKDADFSGTNSSSGRAPIYFKGGGGGVGCQNISVRHCGFMENVTAWGQMAPGVVVHDEILHNNIEVCYSKMFAETSGTSNAVNQIVSASNPPTNVFVYRNSSDTAGASYGTNWTGLAVEDNAFEGGSIVNCTDGGGNVLTADSLDTDLNLQGASRTASLGTTGAEIAT